jgi:long-chain fatty acid transport protein
MKRNAIACAVACALGATAGFDARAAGFALHEQGVSGLGNGYAGAAAVAEDATTVWWNPAGMARLASGKHFAIAGAVIAPSTKFSNGSSVAALGQSLGGEGGDAGETKLIPSMFFAMDLNPRWNFGLGISVPFGLATKYDSNWLGRFQGVESKVETININPAVSYKFSDAASVGAGISWQRGKVDLLTAVNYTAAGAGVPAPFGPIAIAPGTEGQATTSIDDDAWGFNVGGLFNVTPVTRIGIHYRSSLKYNLEGTTSFSSRPAALAPFVPDSNVKLDLKTPDSLAVSGAHRLSDRWDLLADLTWTHWSKIKSLPLVRTSGTMSGSTLDTLTFNFKDVWRASIGANYRFSGPWTLKVGAVYDESPVPDAVSRSVRLPDNDRYWLTAGAKYQVSRSGSLDFGYAFVKVKNADINNNQAAVGKGIVNGTYKAEIHIFGLQYQHTF